MSIKSRLAKAEKIPLFAKPGFGVAILKPSEIAKRVRAILSGDGAQASAATLQSLENLEQVNHDDQK